MHMHERLGVCCVDAPQACGVLRYVSWEMHERARGLGFPYLDVELISLLARLGYLQAAFDAARASRPPDPWVPPSRVTWTAVHTSLRWQRFCANFPACVSCDAPPCQPRGLTLRRSS